MPLLGQKQIAFNFLNRSRAIKSFFGFLPRRIIAVDRDGQLHHYSWRLGWSGIIRIQSQSPLVPFRKGESCVMTIDPAHLFRRRSLIQVKSRADIDRVAPDLFPFAQDGSRFAIYGASANDNAPPYIFAVRGEDLTRFQEKLPVTPAAIVVGGSSQRDVADAVERRLQAGEVTDLTIAPKRFFSPGLWISGFLIVGLLVFGAAGKILMDYQGAYMQRTLQAEIQTLAQKNAQTKTRYLALSKMQSALKQVETIADLPSAQMMARANQILRSLPSGASIDHMEWKEGKLMFSGLGKEAAIQKWLQGVGIAPADINITQLPLLDRYVATLPISQP
jgi:hypothetical protein